MTGLIGLDVSKLDAQRLVLHLTGFPQLTDAATLDMESTICLSA
jgi:hypothetical protein